MTGGVRLLTVGVALTGVLALSGCGYVRTVSLTGQGECEGAPIALQTSQNEAGDVLSIDYTGPANVALILNHGQIEDRWTPDGDIPSVSVAGVDGVDGFQVRIIRLDPTDAGWSTSGSGDATNYHFEGDIQTLIGDSETAWSGSAPEDVDGTLSVFPVVIAAACDDSLASGDFPTSDLMSFSDVPDLEYAAVQPLYPNTMLIDPFEIVSSESTPDGFTLVLRYTPEALAAFGDFTPELPKQISFFPEFEGLSNTNLGDLWHMFASQQSRGVGAQLPATDNGDGTFTVQFSDPDGFVGGSGIVLNAIIPNGTDSVYKVAFHTFVGGPFHTAEPTPTEVAALATTGVDGSVLTLAVGGALTLGGVALIRTRRAKA